MKAFEFINHASIKCDYNGYSLITDPWYISNAFGSWYQQPSPNSNDIYKLINSDENLSVVVSHGHDDHIDDWFIDKHLGDKTFYYPKFPTPGLENRLSKKLGLKTLPIDSGETFGDFTFHQFVNPDFTHYDAVISIETPDFLIIHANDNWHDWPEIMKTNIRKITQKYDNENIFLLIQFGIADCYPVNYKGIDDKQALKISNSRFDKYLHASKRNMTSLNLNHIYFYANQSCFEYKESSLGGQSMYHLAQQYLLEQDLNFTQLEPGMSIHSGHKNTVDIKSKGNLFKYCLNAFENYINEGYKEFSNVNEYVPVRFITHNDNISNDKINYIASNEIWNRILIGELTLESIIVGGLGKISKPNINISHHHHFISKRAYVAQNRIQSIGLRFFEEFAYEA